MLASQGSNFPSPQLQDPWKEQKWWNIPFYCFKEWGGQGCHLLRGGIGRTTDVLPISLWRGEKDRWIRKGKEEDGNPVGIWRVEPKCQKQKREEKPEGEAKYIQNQEYASVFPEGSQELHHQSEWRRHLNKKDLERYGRVEPLDGELQITLQPIEAEEGAEEDVQEPIPAEVDSEVGSEGEAEKVLHEVRGCAAKGVHHPQVGVPQLRKLIIISIFSYYLQYPH